MVRHLAAWFGVWLVGWLVAIGDSSHLWRFAEAEGFSDEVGRKAHTDWVGHKDRIAALGTVFEYTRQQMQTEENGWHALNKTKRTQNTLANKRKET